MSDENTTITVCRQRIAELERERDELKAEVAAMRKDVERYRWKLAQGSPPPPIGDCRKLVILQDKDAMVWVGIRAYNSQGDGYWMNGGARESALVTHWMDLPAIDDALQEAEKP